MEPLANIKVPVNMIPMDSRDTIAVPIYMLKKCSSETPTGITTLSR